MMPSILQIDKKVTYGKSLNTFYNQAIDSIARLKAIKTNLQNLKTKVIEDNDCDDIDVNEIQTKIDAVLSEISEI